MKTKDPKSGWARVLPILAILVSLVFFVVIETGAFASVDSADSASLDLILARLDAFEDSMTVRLDDIDARIGALESQLPNVLGRSTALCWQIIGYELGVQGEVKFEFEGEAEVEAKAPAAVATGVGGRLDLGGTLTPITAGRDLNLGEVTVETCWTGPTQPITNGVVKAGIDNLFAHLQPPDWSIRDATRAIRRAVNRLDPASKLAGIANRLETFLNNSPEPPTLQDLVKPKVLYNKFIDDLGFTTGEVFAPSWMETVVVDLVDGSPKLDSLIDGSVDFCDIGAEFGPGIMAYACLNLMLDLKPPSLGDIFGLVDGVHTIVEKVDRRTSSILGNTRKIGDCHRGLGVWNVGSWASGSCGSRIVSDDDSAASRVKPGPKSR